MNLFELINICCARIQILYSVAGQSAILEADAYTDEERENLKERLEAMHPRFKFQYASIVSSNKYGTPRFVVSLDIVEDTPAPPLTDEELKAVEELKANGTLYSGNDVEPW